MRKLPGFIVGSSVLLASIVFYVTSYRALYTYSNEPDIAIPPANLVVVQSSTTTIPLRLKIPSLSVDAKVQQAGVTKAGSMGIPTNFKDVAWYKYGPVPGAQGTAIIDGHLDNALSLPGVFKYLKTLDVGDDIYVVNASKQELHFKVTQIKLLAYNATSTEEIFGPSTDSNLVLITCGGEWNQSIKKYSSRLIVFSTLVR